MIRIHLQAASCVAIAATMAGGCAKADINSRHHIEIASQPLGAALQALGRQTHSSVVAPADLVANRLSPPVTGDLTLDDALAQMLVGSGLRARHVGAGIVIGPDDSPSTSVAGNADDGPDVVVTGSRIRGAPIASTVISVDAQRALEAGQASLGDIVRSIPQSYGGGQNPAIGFNVPATKGVNVGGGSSIDLRGLGGDATLTLLDGHRLSYSASRQTVDVSAIPLGAVERIDVVADGASALYGSDAVAGVANIVLRKSFQGVETSARLGKATDGGDFEQRYGLTAGTQWRSGGIVASYELARSTAITASQRSFSSDASPVLTLLPPLRNNSALVTAHQDLGSSVSFDVDGLFNSRQSKLISSNVQFGQFYDYTYSFSNRSFAIAPTLAWSIGPWRTFATGSYGSDRTHFIGKVSSAAATTVSPRSCYCNAAQTAEIGADGPLFRFGAAAAKLAIGVGYRNNDFRRFQGVGNPANIKQSQDSYYAYGELNLPFIAPGDGSALGYSLTGSAALRYERYPGIGEIVTPKLGLIYAPTEDFDLKASWGRSFRAPTLQQQYEAPSVVVIAPDIFGGAGYPAGANAFYISGGNPALKPERASTWSATLDLHPRIVPGASLELSYFDIAYRDRIVEPIPYVTQALSNPIYADRITYSPSVDQLAALAQGADIIYIGDGSYDPASVAVLIDDRSVNAGRQNARGIDALARYRIELAKPDQALSLTANASYLRSDQQITPDQPVTPLAGQIFNPPHWRARGGADWDSGIFGVSAFINYAGPVRDSRSLPAPLVSSLTTFDLSVRLGSSRGGTLNGWSVIASVLDLFNAKPARIATSDLGDAPYDSTNYSPVGRFVSLRVGKTW